MPNWYYDKRELKSTPSYADGIEYETEQRYRREGARFIINVGTRMGLRYDTMATGVVYFHRFYMFHSFRTFPRFVTACCCLFLAGKVEETPKKCKDIIKTARILLTDQQFSQFGDDPKEEVMTLERILLQTIKFDLQVDHPYGYLLKYAKSLRGDRAKLQKLVQMAWTFINDSLCTTLCLQWEPEIIGIALMYLAGKLSKFEVNDWNGRTSKHNHWWDMFVENMSIEFLEDICHQVLDLYSTPIPSTPQDSPPTTPPPKARRNATAQKSSPSSPAQSTTPPCQTKIKESSTKTTPAVETDILSNIIALSTSAPTTPVTPKPITTNVLPPVPSVPPPNITIPSVSADPPLPTAQTAVNIPLLTLNQAPPIDTTDAYRANYPPKPESQYAPEQEQSLNKERVHFSGYEAMQSSPVVPAQVKAHTPVPSLTQAYSGPHNSAYPPPYPPPSEKSNPSGMPYFPGNVPPAGSQFPHSSYNQPLPPYYRPPEPQEPYYGPMRHSSAQGSFRTGQNPPMPCGPMHRTGQTPPISQPQPSQGPPAPPPPVPHQFQDSFSRGSGQYRGAGPPPPRPPLPSYPPHHGPMPPEPHSSLPSHGPPVNHIPPPPPPPPSLAQVFGYGAHTQIGPNIQHRTSPNATSLPPVRITGRF